MSIVKTTALALGLALSAGATFAQDTAAKSPAEGKSVVTMQECRELATAKKDGVAKDEATLKKEASCSDLLRKEDAKAGTATEPAKK